MVAKNLNALSYYAILQNRFDSLFAVVFFSFPEQNHGVLSLKRLEAFLTLIGRAKIQSRLCSRHQHGDPFEVLQFLRVNPHRVR